MPIITYPNIVFPVATTTPSRSTQTAFNHPAVNPTYNPTRRDTRHVTELNYIEPVLDYSRYTCFPIGGPTYRLSVAASQSGGVQIQPWMHLTSGLDITDTTRSETYKNALKVYNAVYQHNTKFAYTANAHYHSASDPEHPDLWNNDTLGSGTDDILVDGYPVEFAPGAYHTPAEHINLYPYNANNRPAYQFRGAMTEINPEGEFNEEKNIVLKQGVESYDRWIAKQENDTSDESLASPLTPTSPLHPFTRVHPNRAHHAIVSSYNRTRLPISDIEHRKAFQYIFISRPECYLMSSGDQLCMQAMQDEDINAVFYRMPYVIRALSPVYITGNGSSMGPAYANWNYLLSNRVINFSSPGGNTLSVVDSMTKAVRGATVTPGKLLTSQNGGSLEITFRDTKYMDVYEMLRAWMWYIHKRKIGKFFPPFNGYQYSNNFIASGKIPNTSFNMIHPYDRALEYCCSLWNVITDESGMNILYWCKYYGLFPTQASSSIIGGGSHGSAINNEATVSAQFQYQYKRENVFKNLVEFNFNAGIVDQLGNARSDVVSYLQNALSYLNRQDGEGGSGDTSNVLLNYGGASSLFTGSPYIISQKTGAQDPWSGTGNSGIVKSQLCFMPAGAVSDSIDRYMNLRINNTSRNVPTDMFF